MKNRIMKPMALILALGVGVVACEDMNTTGPDGQPDGPATLKVLLTDAAADYVDAAWVDIGKVQLVPADGEGPIITLTEDGTDGMVDLLSLQNGATEQLAEAEIEAGEYEQLRLFVDSARVDLIEGYTFRDGSTSKRLFVPSGAQTGIKLNLWPADGMGDGDMDEEGRGVFISSGETVLVLDFDVNQSFVIQGNPETPAGILSMLFTPTIRVTVEDVAGSISGTVAGAADSIDVEGLTVTAEPTGSGTVDGYQTTTATAQTGSDGSYTLHYLVPGEYEVTVDVGEGFATDPTVATVTVGEDEDVTGVDFTVDESAGSISGAVTAADDSISISELTVTAADTAAGNAYTADTDEGGLYSMDSVLPGDYLVTVEVPEGFATSPDTANVTVAVNEDVTDVDFEVDEDEGEGDNGDG